MSLDLLPTRGEGLLPATEGGNSFLGSLIRSATAPEAQVFTEAAYPFKICHANNAWSLLCGWSVPEALGKTCKILQGPETDPDRLRELHAGLAANRKTSVQLINYTKSRDRFLSELTVEPLLNQAGEVTHFVGTLRPLAGPKSAGSSPQASKERTLLQSSRPPSTVSGGSSAASSGKGAMGEQGRSSAASTGSVAAGGSVLGAPPGLSAPQNTGPEYTDLLSRGSFPLHTLNHHPNAPVLLRMLQLNNCSMGRSSLPSRDELRLQSALLLPPVLERALSAGTATSTEPDSNDAWSDHASDDISLLSTDDECPMHLIALQKAGEERRRRMRRAPCNSRGLPIIFCIRVSWCPYRPSMNYLILPWCRRDSQLRHTLRQGLRDAGSPVSLLATEIIELLICASVGSDPRLMEIM